MKFKYGMCGRQRINYRFFTAANILIHEELVWLRRKIKQDKEAQDDESQNPHVEYKRKKLHIDYETC